MYDVPTELRGVQIFPHEKTNGTIILVQIIMVIAESPDPSMT